MAGMHDLRFVMQSAMWPLFHVETSCAGASLVLYRAQDIAGEQLARHADGVSSPTAVPTWLQALPQSNPPIVRVLQFPVP